MNRARLHMSWMGLVVVGLGCSNSAIPPLAGGSSGDSDDTGQTLDGNPEGNGSAASEADDNVEADGDGGDGGGDGSQDDGDTGDTGDTGDESGESGQNGDSGETSQAPQLDLPTIRPDILRLVEPEVVEPPCPGSEASDGTVTDLRYGQTHMVHSDWPFQTVVAGRPLTVALGIVGSGIAPRVQVEARLESGEFGPICLVGPDALPSEIVDLGSDVYSATLPSDWVQPGLSLTFTSGAEVVEIDIPVRQHIALTIHDVTMVLFGEGNEEAWKDTDAIAYLARLPVSELQLSRNPFGVWRPDQLLLGPRDDGKAPTGEAMPHGPIVIREGPHRFDTTRRLRPDCQSRRAPSRVHVATWSRIGWRSPVPAGVSRVVRACYVSGRSRSPVISDDYLDFHKARELDRNHLSRYEHGEVSSLQLPGKRKSLLRIVQ